MRIGLNLLYLIPGFVGGTESYARGLLAGLAAVGRGHDYIVFTNEEAEEWPLPAGFRRVVCPVQAMYRERRYAFEQLRLPIWVRAEEIDVLHSLGYVAPLLAPCASVVTIPDLNTRAFGHHLSLSKRIALGAFTNWSAARSDHVLTISFFSKDRICEILDIPREKVTVTHLASNVSAPVRDPADISEKRPYFVTFSSASPNKNIPLLLEAFARSRALGVEHDLVLVGHRPAGDFGPLPPGARLTGWLQDAERDAVLGGADLLVLPSLYEGFGLPVLEAMALGVPVLSSNRASLPEVGAGAAEYFDPESVGELADALSRLAADAQARDRMRHAGFENVKRFSWEMTATRTLEAYCLAVAAASARRGAGSAFSDAA